MNFKKYHVSRNVMPAGEQKTVESKGVTFTSDGNGRYHIRGTATAYASVRFNLLSAFTTPTSVSNGGQGTLSFFNTQSNNNVNFVFYNGTTNVDAWRQTPIGRTSIVYNAVGNKYVDNIVITVDSGTSVDMTIAPEFTNDGVLPSGFEPYSSEVWHDTPHYIHNTSTDTLTTLPAVVYANGTTATVGLKGQAVQSSTPSPTSPVMPEGCGNKTANLWNAIKYTYTSLSDSSLWVYSSSLTGSVYRVPCMPNTKYTLYLAENVDISIWRICEVSTDVAPNASSTSVPTTGAYATAVPAAKSATFTTSATAKYILFQTNEAAYDSVLPVIMFIEGTSKIPYEPYGVKIPILSADTTTNIYLGEVETTRKIKKLVLDGTEEWYLFEGTNIWQFYINNAGLSGIARSSAMSNIAPYGATPDDRQYHEYGCFLVTGGTGVAFQMKGAKNTFTGITAWKAYLAQQYTAGTPVCVWYVLANEETGIVNEPLMKIGTYADSLTTSIPCTAGSNSFDVDTTVQPSEVTATYEGWHPVQSAHEYGGGWN